MNEAAFRIGYEESEGEQCTLESTDDERGGGRNDGDDGLTVLDGKLDGNP